MKKRIRSVSLLVLALGICVAVGFTEIPNINDNTRNTHNENVIEDVESLATERGELSIQETVTVENLSQTILNEQLLDADKNNETIIGETLTDKDRKVKSEISKHINTTVDFRYNKQEMMQHQEIKLSFSGVEEFQGKKELIAYNNDLGDEFLYKSDTGKLFLARINSNIVQKVEKSIDLNTAQKIAEECVSKNYATNEMILSQFQEVEEGYFFEYSKFLFKYKTNATFEIIISFEGNVVYIRDSVGLLDEVDDNIEENFIEQRYQEIADKYAEEDAEIKKVSILIENDKIYLVSTISYNLTGITIELVSNLG